MIAGKFRVERVLGEGGMGYVVAARHLQLGQVVALKFMRDEVLTPDYRTRFMREARNTVRLKSKHVSRVLDVGALESGVPYMVMEYLEGTDLSALLHSRGPFPAHEACEYVLQACEALAEAHGYGIVHRDLKPANLFLTRGAGGEPVVKVLDFGVSKVVELAMEQTNASGGISPTVFDVESVVTKATDLLGSPSYMAPEQIVSARDADSRSDIWSLGVILFRLISGKAPFGAQALGELIQQIVHGATPNLRDYRPDLPPGLEHIVARCLERDRDRRLSDVVELARLLAPYAGAVATPSLERIAVLGPALVTTAPRQALPSGPTLGSGSSPTGWTSPAGGQPPPPRPSFPGLPPQSLPPSSLPPSSLPPQSLPPQSMPPQSHQGGMPPMMQQAHYGPVSHPGFVPVSPEALQESRRDLGNASATALGVLFAVVVLAAVFAVVKFIAPQPVQGAPRPPDDAPVVAPTTTPPPQPIQPALPPQPTAVMPTNAPPPTSQLPTPGTVLTTGPQWAPPAPTYVPAPVRPPATTKPRPKPTPTGGGAPAPSGDDIPATRD